MTSDPNHIHLSELASLIKQTFSNHLEPTYWVIAEIGEMRVNQKGHCYLDLIEHVDKQIVAKIKATIWAYQFRNINGWFETITGSPLADGMKVLAKVEVQFHEVYGLSINIKDIDAHYTLGERARQRQEVINKLEEEGVIDMNKGLDLPLVIQRIAVISSPSAAGYGDFMDQISNNSHSYQYQMDLFPAAMQGKVAVEEIVRALHRIYDRVEEYDVVVLIRGGGAQTDFECFDMYDLAVNLAQFPLPILTGIGHERDETVADIVAHTKMKTPTAVSEFLIYHNHQFEEQINELLAQTFYLAESAIREHSLRLDDINSRLKTQTTSLVYGNYKLLQETVGRLLLANQSVFMKNTHALDDVFLKVKQRSTQMITSEKLRVDSIENEVRLLSPQNILDRGYTITRINDVLLRNVNDLTEGQEMVTESAKGKISSVIKGVRRKKG